MIQGLPGLGLIGKIAVDFLIDQLKPTKFAEFFSPYLVLPDGGVGVKVELDSTFTLPKYEFYAYQNTPNIILLTGDTQPRPSGQYTVATNVLDFVGRFGCKKLIALGGYAVQKRNMNIIYAVASERSIVDDLKEKFNVQPAQSGMIKGSFGVMLGLGRERNINCLGLLGATAGIHPDMRVSRNVIQLIANMFNLTIDLSEMDKRIEDMKIKVKRFRAMQPPTEIRENEGDIPHRYIT